jgi:hypothetical protein
MIYFINIKTASRLVKNEPQMRRFSEETGLLSTTLLLAHLRLESTNEEVVSVPRPDSCRPRRRCRLVRIVRTGWSTAHLPSGNAQLSAGSTASRSPLALTWGRP